MVERYPRFDEHHALFTVGVVCRDALSGIYRSGGGGMPVARYFPHSTLGHFDVGQFDASGGDYHSITDQLAVRSLRAGLGKTCSGHFQAATGNDQICALRSYASGKRHTKRDRKSKAPQVVALSRTAAAFIAGRQATCGALGKR